MSIARRKTKIIVEYAIDQAIDELTEIVDKGKADREDILDNLDPWPDFRDAWEKASKQAEEAE